MFQRRGNELIDLVIADAYKSVDGRQFNHVALYVGRGKIIEALEPLVRSLDLDNFLAASVMDASGRPEVAIGRLKTYYWHLLPGAIAAGWQLVGLPYNKTFRSEDEGYYCSELILRVFNTANGGRPFFEEIPMSFKDPGTGNYFDYWIDYFAELEIAIPEGEPGSHPALLSRSDKIEMITG